MNCFPCFTSQKSKKSNSRRESAPSPQEQPVVTTRAPEVKKAKPEDHNQVDNSTPNIHAQNFTFRELAIATKNFRQECLMGEGGFGRVYKGTIPATGQVVAVKQLDRNGMNNSKEFLGEVSMLSQLTHENLVKLVGYCADGDQRLLVYEFMPGASLERRLLERGPDESLLDWYNRMKIASFIAKGLWYLHDQANPPVIYRDLKSSNILLDNDYNAKLSDYGLAKLAGKDKMNIAPTRVMGTYGYSAPEYVSTGNLTLKSDVYSFGVVLLELITGRRAIDTTRPHDEQNLVSWAQPIFRDPKKYSTLADKLLGNNFIEKDLNQVVAIAAMCLQEEAAARPLMSDVVTALSFLSTTPPPPQPQEAVPLGTQASQKSAAGGESESEAESDNKNSSDDDNYDQREVGESSKYQDSDTSDSDYDYYDNENQQEYSPRDTEGGSKSSRTRSRNDAHSSGQSSDSEEDGRDSAGQKSIKASKDDADGAALSQKSKKKSSKDRDLSQKSSRRSSKNKDLSKKSRKKSSKDSDLSQKSSKKDRELRQKSSKKSSLSQKSSKKSSVKYSSHENGNNSGGEESSQDEGGANMLLERSNSSKPSQGDVSFGPASSKSNHGSSSINLGHNNSMGSEEGSSHLGQTSMRKSDAGSVDS